MPLSEEDVAVVFNVEMANGSIEMAFLFDACSDAIRHETWYRVLVIT